MQTQNHSDERPFEADRAPSLTLTVAVLVGLILVTLLGNLYWIRENVVMIGHDATSYLETSIKYTRFFTNLSLPQLFQAFTFPDYRTPAIYIATQPFMHLFGSDMDGAQALNVALFPLVILATYLLGRRVSSVMTGLTAATIIAFLPLSTAMARLYYVEILLTVLVTVNLWALYRCRHFGARSWSILWGISAGIGLLTKWTFPMYIFLPAIWVLIQSQLWRDQIAWIKRPHIEGRRLLVAVAVGSAMALLWYWPNREPVAHFLLGEWLLAGWLILAVLTVYALLATTSALSNWWSGVLLAVIIASLWYLPYIDFPLRLLEIDRVRAPDGASPLHFSNYTRYFSFFYREHLGMLAFWLIVPAGLFPWVRSWFRRASLNRSADLLWLSVISAYIVLSLILQHNARNLVPLLPQTAILLAIGLHGYGQRTATGIGAIWLSVLVLQWSLFTFQPLAPAFAASARLWVDSDYVVSPASGTTDPGYWIAPDVLATIGDSEDDPEGEPDSLGILVETWEVHRGIFRYLATRDEQNVTIMALTEPESRGWSDALANRWLLVNEGDNSDVAGPGQAVLQRIQAGDQLFHQLYQAKKEYVLPDGDSITLYQRRAGHRQPLDFPVLLIETAEIADAINRYASPESTLFFSSADTATWVGIHDLAVDQVVIAEERSELLSALQATTGTLLLVTRYDGPEIEDALDGFGYFATEAGDGEFHLTVLGHPDRASQPMVLSDDWEEISITRLDGVDSVSPGEVIPLEMDVAGQTDGSLKMSVRLQQPDGLTVAQQDVALTPSVRLGLLVPPESSAGLYQIVGVVYDAATVAPIPNRSGQQEGTLTSLLVVAE